MKTLFILVLLIFVTSCKNPFDKYKDSVDDLQSAIVSAQTIKTQIDIITTKLNGGLNNLEVTEVYAALQEINNNLSGEVIQSIVSSFAEQYNIDLEAQMATIQTDVSTALDSYVPEEGQPSKEEVEALLSSILAKL